MNVVGSICSTARRPSGSARQASIVKATGLTIKTSRVLQHGAYNVIVEVNGEWIFRFPRPGSPRG